MNERALKVWRYMLQYQQEHTDPVSPTMSEIMDACGYPGRNSVFYVLRRLLDAGLVREVERAHRKYVAVEFSEEELERKLLEPDDEEGKLESS
jgi:sugar-specific transcriptional regulator TrmB